METQLSEDSQNTLRYAYDMGAYQSLHNMLNLLKTNRNLHPDITVDNIIDLIIECEDVSRETMVLSKQALGVVDE